MSIEDEIKPGIMLREPQITRGKLTHNPRSLEDESRTEKPKMANSDCESSLSKVHNTAGELYQLAALMLGDEARAADLVETVVTKANIDPCADAETSVNAARINLVETAVAHLSENDPAAFNAPAPSANPGGCIDDDDLSSAGISSVQLAEMVSGPGRRTLRDWLNKLPVAQRAVFVERAILGWDNATAAASLSKAASSKWQPRQVSDTFRQALCSLATSLVHATVSQV